MQNAEPTGCGTSIDQSEPLRAPYAGGETGPRGVSKWGQRNALEVCYLDSKNDDRRLPLGVSEFIWMVCSSGWLARRPVGGDLDPLPYGTGAASRRYTYPRGSNRLWQSAGYNLPNIKPQPQGLQAMTAGGGVWP